LAPCTFSLPSSATPKTIKKYENPFESLKKAISEAGGLGDISADSKVFIKPNLVTWYEGVNFPKFGVLTTARLIEDIVIILSEHGIRDITLVEGAVEREKNSDSLLKQAVKGMGLDTLTKRYGLKTIDVHRGNFTKITIDDVKLLICKLCRPILSNYLRQQSSFSYYLGKRDESTLDKLWVPFLFD